MRMRDRGLRPSNPKGSFTIVRKHHPYTSKKYKVPMDYAMFFTKTGEALHQNHGRRRGGCCGRGRQ